MYKAQCQWKVIEYVQGQVFLNIFNVNFNIGIHTPKKEKSGTCENFQNIPDESQMNKKKISLKNILKMLNILKSYI